jgi:hypothetical protein
MIQAKRNLLAVEIANGALVNYILANQLAKGGTVAERKNWAEDVAAKGYKLEAELANFIEILEVIIADCDAAGWGQKRIIDALQITSKPEQNL